jgi:hypothetical protein
MEQPQLPRMEMPQIPMASKMLISQLTVDESGKLVLNAQQLQQLQKENNMLQQQIMFFQQQII